MTAPKHFNNMCKSVEKYNWDTTSVHFQSRQYNDCASKAPDFRQVTEVLKKERPNENAKMKWLQKKDCLSSFIYSCSTVAKNSYRFWADLVHRLGLTQLGN